MDKKIKYICVDDDYLDLLDVQSNAKRSNILECAGAFSNANDAIVALADLKADVVFTDIDMPNMNGIDFIKQLRNTIPVAVLITSHPEYALESYELSVLDYILKPINEVRFDKCIKRIEDYLNSIKKAEAFELSVESQQIIIKEGTEKIKLLRSDIHYMEAMQDYTKVVTSTRKYMVNQPLSTFLATVNEEIFMRIHRSYAVNKERVKSWSKTEIIGDIFHLPVGKTYKSFVTKNNM